LDGLGDVGNGQVRPVIKIGDGASYLKDTIVGAGGQPLLLHGALEKLLGVGSELAKGPDLAGTHLRIGINLLFGVSEPVPLQLSRFEDSGADNGRAFGGCTSAQLSVLDGWDLYMDIDAVEERAGDFRYIALDQGWRTVALARLGVEVSARARVISLLKLPCSICRCGSLLTVLLTRERGP
jgi:hypothetical protein